MGSLQNTRLPPQEENRFQQAIQCTTYSSSGHLAIECPHRPHCPTAIPGYTRSSNVSTICSTEPQPPPSGRSSPRTTTHATKIVHPTVIGMSSVQGHRISSDQTMISIPRMTVTDQKTDITRAKATTDIAMTNIEQTITTAGTRMTETTSTNHGTHGTINVTLITVSAIIDSPMTIIAKNLLTPNLVGLSHTPSRGTTRPTNGLTPRLHGSPLTVHTIVFKTTEAKQGTQRRSPV